MDERWLWGALGAAGERFVVYQPHGSPEFETLANVSISIPLRERNKEKKVI